MTVGTSGRGSIRPVLIGIRLLQCRPALYPGAQGELVTNHNQLPVATDRSSERCSTLVTLYVSTVKTHAATCTATIVGR